MQEQKYQAVLAVLVDGVSVSEVAQRWGVSRQSVHAWLRRYEDEGLAGLEPRSSRPASCPHQADGVVEARILELRRVHPGWGPRRILYELGKAADAGELGVRGCGATSANRHRRVAAPPERGTSVRRQSI